jgi:hypothetical protein
LKHDRTIFNAGATTGATVLDDGTGALSDFDLEISRGSLYAFKVCIGDELDV